MIDIDSVIKGCVEGDPRMQRELYDRYSPFLYSLCRRYMADDEKAMEALVESFLLIYSNIDSYKGDGPIEGWMTTITTRKIVDLYRRDRMWAERATDIENLPGVKLEPDYDLQIDVRDALVKSLRKLTAMERTLFNLIAVEGYSYQAVGKKMKMPVTTVKSRYYKVREKMQLLMGRHFDTKRYRNENI